MAAAEMNLVDLCKLLLDEVRLKFLGQVALAPLSVEELGQRLGIKERDLPRHRRDGVDGAIYGGA